MKRIPVAAPSIISIGWENETMEIEYRGGTVKAYLDVPYVEYCSFLNSAAPGAALTHFLKQHPDGNSLNLANNI